jgi:hypothetical protein
MTSTQMTYLRCFSRIQAISMTCLAGYSCKWGSNSRGEAIGARIISILNNCSGAIHTPARSDPREAGSLFQHRLVPEVSDSQDREDLHSNNKSRIHQVKTKHKAAAEQIKGTEIKTKVQTISTIIDNLGESLTTLILKKIHLKLLRNRLKKKLKMLAGVSSESSWC